MVVTIELWEFPRWNSNPPVSVAMTTVRGRRNGLDLE